MSGERGGILGWKAEHMSQALSGWRSEEEEEEEGEASEREREHRVPKSTDCK